MSTFTISRKDWRDLITAVLPHASTGDLPVLSSVKLECDGPSLLAVATDRYTLAACRHTFPTGDGEETPEPFTFLLDRATAIESLKLFKPKRRFTFPLRITIDGESISLHDDAAAPDLTLNAKPVNAEFPKWREMVTKMFDGETGLPEGIAVNGHFLARWAAAVRGGEPVRLQHRGPTEPILVSIGDRFLGVQMSIRLGDNFIGGYLDRDHWQAILNPPEPKPKRATRKKAKAA